RQTFNLQPEPAEQTLYLVTGAAGDGAAGDTVIWQRPRFERPGRQPLLLRDVRAMSAVIDRLRSDALAATSRYLAAAYEARDDENADPALLAERHNVDPLVLHQWLAYLGIATSGELQIKDYMTHRLANVGGYDFVRGWGIDGLDALSIVGNASDQVVNIPGTLNAHRVAVHPRPERWIAAGWKSPIAGRVRVSAH